MWVGRGALSALILLACSLFRMLYVMALRTFWHEQLHVFSYLSPGTLYRSEDAGATWQPIPHSQVSAHSLLVPACYQFPVSLSALPACLGLCQKTISM